MSLIKNKSKSNFLYLFFNRFFQNDFSKIIVDNIRTKKTINIFDVGSYIGEFSLNLKEVISNNANFYLFDPNPNLKIKNFNFFNIALDKNNSKKKFYFNEFLPHSGSSLKKITMDDLLWNFTRKLFLLSLNKKFKTLFVKTQTLDNFCKEKNISKIEVLKIDVEGGELDILNGSKKMLKNIWKKKSATAPCLALRGEPSLESAAIHVSAYCYLCVLILLYVCVLMLLYMCPHTTISRKCI